MQTTVYECLGKDVTVAVVIGDGSPAQPPLIQTAAPVQLLASSSSVFSHDMNIYLEGQQPAHDSPGPVMVLPTG